MAPTWIIYRTGATDLLPYMVTATIRPLDGRLHVTDMLIAQVPNGQTLTRSGVVTISPSDILHGARVFLTDENKKALNLTDASIKRAILSATGPNKWERFAFYYRALRATSDNAGEQLSQILSISRATITRWLQKCERMKLIDALERGSTKHAPHGGRSLNDINELVGSYAELATRN